MREFTEEEIKALLPMIEEVIRSKEFKAYALNDIMSAINRTRLFDAKEYLDHSDRDDVFEDYVSDMNSWEMGKFMSSYGFIHESDVEEPYQAANLMEEQVDELLGQLKRKFDYLPNLEKALGSELVADLRGFPDHKPQPDTTNYNPNCYCSKVVDLEGYEIISCCERSGHTAHEQWLGNNHEGDFVCMTCTCGKTHWT